MKTTSYFKQSVILRRPYLTVAMCEQVINNPTYITIQDDGRVRYFGKVAGKWMRVIVDNGELHNAFFDRGFKP